MPSLAIVIVNYNTRDLLAHCLRSVYTSRTSVSCHVVVVDNSSSDDSVSMLKSSFPQATLILSDRNGGFGYANNLALRWLAARASLPGVGTGGGAIEARGTLSGEQPAVEIPARGDSPYSFPCDYVLFLNPDTVLPPEALEVTTAFLQAHPEVGIAGPKMVKLDGSLDLACRRAFPTPLNALFKLSGLARLFPRHPLIARYNLTNLPADRLAAVDSVMGAFMLVRGTALGQAGLFDERFFMYGEDLDLAYRLKARGWQVFYNPAVTVLHIKGASSRKRSARSIREFYRAMHVFYTKHYAAKYGRLVSALVRLGITLRGLFALALNATRPAAQKRVG